MANPPKMVKMAMESICLLIGEPTRDWKSIRSILIRENFIPTILSFSTEDIMYVCMTMWQFRVCMYGAMWQLPYSVYAMWQFYTL